MKNGNLERKGWKQSSQGGEVDKNTGRWGWGEGAYPGLEARPEPQG